MEKSKKVEQYELIKDLFNSSTGIFLTNYSGINVADINKLRVNFRKEGVTYKVLKNTLVKKLLKDTGSYSELNDQLVGMIGIAFVGDNVTAPAKIIKKYFDETGKLAFKGCYIESGFYGPDQLNVIASMPSKPEIISSIISSIAAPASGIVGAINAVMRDVVSVIDQISKREAA